MTSRIQHLEFGKIVVDNKEYTDTDLVVFWNSVEKCEKTHKPILDEIKKICLKNPEIIIISTGFSDCVKVSEEIENYLKNKKIELIKMKTPDATKRFKELISQGKQAAVRIHTTC